MKIIKLFTDWLLEDVGDKYAEKRFGIKPNFSTFYNKYAKHINRERILYDNGDMTIIKNPLNLNKIGDDVRGVIDSEGNLYVEQRSIGIHSDILDILYRLHIVKPDNKWHLKIPTEFVTVQRKGDTNSFWVGESNTTMVEEVDRKGWFYKDIPKYEDAAPVFAEFFRKAKLKVPNINFVNIKINRYC